MIQRTSFFKITRTHSNQQNVYPSAFAFPSMEMQEPFKVIYAPASQITKIAVSAKSGSYRHLSKSSNTHQSSGKSPPQHMFSAISSLTTVSSACMVGTLVLDTNDVPKLAFNILKPSNLKWELLRSVWAGSILIRRWRKRMGRTYCDGANARFQGFMVV